MVDIDILVNRAAELGLMRRRQVTPSQSPGITRLDLVSNIVGPAENTFFGVCETTHFRTELYRGRFIERFCKLVFVLG